MPNPYADPTKNELQPLIYFPHPGDSMKPVRVWTIVPYTANELYIWCSQSPDQAMRGLGDVKERTRLLPYTADFWEKCEFFVDFRTQANKIIQAEYDALRVGKELTAQIPMFDPFQTAVSALKMIANYGKLNAEKNPNPAATQARAHHREIITLAETALKTIGIR